MNVHKKFLSINYIKAIVYVFAVMLSLVIILNLLTEIEFFKNYDAGSFLPIYLALLNSFDALFEMFPFIFLIATQIFFLNLFTDNQINIFKYSGLKNTKIIMVISILTFLIGIVIITLYYSFSSNLKNLYLSHKNKYTLDNKYLAVITNNGLWIMDVVDQYKLIINAAEIDNNLLKNVNVSIFNKNSDLLKIINSEKVDIQSNEWILYNANSISENNTEINNQLKIYSNFNYERINNLFSNLSSLSLLELIELRKNYNRINYSTIEIDKHLQKLISYPLYLLLMTMLSSAIMLNTKKYKSTTFKIIVGLFFCVIVYYLKNLFQTLGDTERVPLIISNWITFVLLAIFIWISMLKINEK